MDYNINVYPVKQYIMMKLKRRLKNYTLENRN